MSSHLNEQNYRHISNGLAIFRQESDRQFVLEESNPSFRHFLREMTEAGNEKNPMDVDAMPTDEQLEVLSGILTDCCQGQETGPVELTGRDGHPYVVSAGLLDSQKISVFVHLGSAHLPGQPLLQENCGQRNFLHADTDLLFVLNPEGIIQEVNDAVEHLLGYRTEELTGRQVLDLVHPEDRDRTTQAAADLLGNGIKRRVINRLLTSAGQIRWIEWNSQVSDGRILGSARDVTDRIRNQDITGQMLVLSERMLASEGEPDDYEEIMRVFLSITGARYGLFNAYQDNGMLKTLALRDPEGIFARVSRETGLAFEGKRWDHDPDVIRKVQGMSTVVFSSLVELAGRLVKTPDQKEALQRLQDRFGLGGVVLVKILHQDRLTGNFLLLMNRHQPYKDDVYAEMLIRQLGLYLDRQQTRRQLVEQRNMMNQLINHMQDMIFFKDPNGRYLFCNDAYARYLGRSCGEIVGRDEQSFYPGHVFSRFSEEDANILAQRTIRRFERPVVYPDGAGRTVDTLLVPVYDQEGKALGILGVSRDVSERRELEEQIRQHNVHLKQVIDSVPNYIYAKDEDDVYLLMNRAMSAVMGIDPDDAVGRFEADFNPNRETVSRYHDENRQVIQTKRPLLIPEEQIPKADGTIGWFQTQKIPYQHPQWPKPGVLCVSTEITARKNIEQTLQEKLAFEQSVSMIASSFINMPLGRLDEAVDRALGLCCEHFGVDRAFVFTFSDDGQTMTKRGERYPEELAPWTPLKEEWKPQQKTYTVDQMNVWSGPVLAGEVVHVPDLDSLPELTEREKEHYRRIGVQSFLTIPMIREGKTIGFMGFDSIKQKKNWPDEQILLLRIVVDLVAGALSKHETERRLRYLSLHDTLTGLPNRSSFEEQMTRFSDRSHDPVCVLSADIDGLKLVNDTLGHHMGDRLLQAGAGILQTVVRTQDVLARVGGDEFVMLLPQTDERQGSRIMGQIEEEAERYNREHSTLPISMSLGISCRLASEEDLKETYRRADDAMYRNKMNKESSGKSYIINALMATLGERDYITEGHGRRLADLTMRIGISMNLDSGRRDNLNLLAQVHDLGKVGIPDDILFKPGPLTDDEWEIMKQHPEKGYRIASSSPDLSGIADLILKHHEKWDGSGYPLGVSGQDIPLECRILAVVDAFDAMTQDRPYAKARTHADACAELHRCSGTQFDPQVVDVFMHVLTQKE